MKGVRLIVPAGALLALVFGGSLAGAGASADPSTCLGKRSTIVGTAGNDSIAGTAGRDVINGGDGNDTIDGGGGRDVVCGGEGDDNVIGGAGADELSGDGGNDRIDGGAGLDYAIFDASPAGVSADLAKGGATGWGSDTLVGIEALVGSRFGDVLNGTGKTNYLAGLAGADSLTGGGGNDYLDGGAGNDVLNGQKGFDTADFFFAPGGVRASLPAGTARGFGKDRLAGIEDLDGSRFRDVLIGNSRANWLRGFGGHDVIRGNGGPDRLEGEAGRDHVSGGRGNDRIKGGAARDRLFGGPGRDRVMGGGGRDVCRSELKSGCP